MSKVYKNFDELQIFSLLQYLCKTEYESIEELKEDQKSAMLAICEIFIPGNKNANTENEIENMKNIGLLIGMLAK